MFHFIVNEIYRVEGCYMVMDADGLFDISDYSRMDEKKVSDIIDYCAELGLFNQELWQDKQILTSEEIQELYVGICKAIHRKPGIPESILCWKRNRHRSPPPHRMPLVNSRTSRHMNAILRPPFRRMRRKSGRL